LPMFADELVIPVTRVISIEDSYLGMYTSMVFVYFSIHDVLEVTVSLDRIISFSVALSRIVPLEVAVARTLDFEVDL